MQTLFDGWIPILRTVVAGVCAYILLVALLRVSGKRTLSKMNAFDFVVTVALGSTLATIFISSKDVSVATGFAGLATLVGMQYVVTWLSVRYKTMRRLSRSEPTLLVHNGELLEKAMRAERVSRDEVLAAVREAGLADVEEVGALVLETNGTFSLLRSVHSEDPAALSKVDGFHERKNHDNLSPGQGFDR